MKTGPLLLVVAVAGTVWGCAQQADDAAAPAGETRYMSSNNPWAKDHVAAAAVQPGPQPQAEAAPSGEATLQRHANGHFYAAVSVGGRDAEMLVDTGASVVALTGEDALTLGVEWNPNAVVPVAKGASGTVFGVPVRLERVRLGDIEVRGVEAVVVPEGLPISLLGQSFLGRVGRLEIAGDRMVLGG
ncbi:MAG: hypothetical protein B7Z08_03200 [Sphingomonadales bacterium 32-68-7]|nr:MAG: hypothetical protein B7Z33_07870 [Sphingomonadales bacterium 12-68-11]OYX09942.1 MAG: hypothetical protein B7Z08_03200 [Sphingomonadales bacterium 32-68-7]